MCRYIYFSFDTKQRKYNCLVFRYEKRECAEHDSELAVADLTVPVLVDDTDHLVYLLVRDLVQDNHVMMKCRASVVTTKFRGSFQACP